eukprot:320259_1
MGGPSRPAAADENIMFGEKSRVWDFEYFDEYEEIRLDQDFDTAVIVDGLPKVGADKFKRLDKTIRNIFSAHGDMGKTFNMPQDDEGSTMGYAFLEYETAEQARSALSLHRKRLDKRHQFGVYLMSDYKRLTEMSEEYVAPSVNDVKVPDDPNTWLEDPFGRDQYVVRTGPLTEVYWNDPIRTDIGGRDPSVERVRKNVEGAERKKERPILPQSHLTDGYVQWSPLGSYLIVMHPGKDVVLYAGEQLKQVHRFSHDGVIMFGFSPQENYLVTFGKEERTLNKGTKKEQPGCLVVWDVKRDKVARGFAGGWALEKEKGRGLWPVFKWSHDDKYLARQGDGLISIYETPSMKLLGKESISIRNLATFEWSPSDHLISYTVPENENMPARVAIIDIPSRELIGNRSLQLVSSLKMHWHNMGRFLAVKVTHVKRLKGKDNKDVSTSFEIFQAKRKNCPVDRVVLKDVTKVVAFSFEPYGTRFGVIHGEYPGYRSDVSLYQITASQIKTVAQLEKQPASHLFWSPAGRYLVIAGIGENNGTLHFYDTNRLLSLKESDHYMLTGVDWSPCGRYVMTSVTQPVLSAGGSRTTMENGYKVWNHLGEEIVDQHYQTLFQFLWRPRAPSPLTKAQKDSIRENISKFAITFDREDESVRESTLGVVAQRRRRQLMQWREWRAQCVKAFASEKSQRVHLRDGLLSDDEAEWDEEKIVIDEQIDAEQEIVE